MTGAHVAPETTINNGLLERERLGGIRIGGKRESFWNLGEELAFRAENARFGTEKKSRL